MALKTDGDIAPDGRAEKERGAVTADVRFWTISGAVFVLSCIIRLAFYFTPGKTGAGAVIFTGVLILFQTVCGAAYLARLVRGFYGAAGMTGAGKYISLCAVFYCVVTLLFSWGYIKDMFSGTVSVSTSRFLVGGERDYDAYDSGYPFIIFEDAGGSLVTAEISYETADMLKSIPADGGTAAEVLKTHSKSIDISYYPNTLILSDISVEKETQ